MIVWVLAGARYGPREHVFDAVIDKVDVKRSASSRRARSSTTTRRSADPRRWRTSSASSTTATVTEEDTVTVIRFSAIKLKTSASGRLRCVGEQELLRRAAHRMARSRCPLRWRPRFRVEREAAEKVVFVEHEPEKGSSASICTRSAMRAQANAWAATSRAARDSPPGRPREPRRPGAESAAAWNAGCHWARGRKPTGAAPSRTGNARGPGEPPPSGAAGRRVGRRADRLRAARRDRRDARPRLRGGDTTDETGLQKIPAARAGQPPRRSRPGETCEGASRVTMATGRDRKSPAARSGDEVTVAGDGPMMYQSRWTSAAAPP